MMKSKASFNKHTTKSSAFIFLISIYISINNCKTIMKKKVKDFALVQKRKNNVINYNNIYKFEIKS
jgi:hypothetical protein